jgi:hypothetical protein
MMVFIRALQARKALWSRMLFTQLAWKGPAQRNPLEPASRGPFLGIDEDFYINTKPSELR